MTDISARVQTLASSGAGGKMSDGCLGRTGFWPEPSCLSWAHGLLGLTPGSDTRRVRELQAPTQVGLSSRTAARALGRPETLSTYVLVRFGADAAIGAVDNSKNGSSPSSGGETSGPRRPGLGRDVVSLKAVGRTPPAPPPMVAPGGPGLEPQPPGSALPSSGLSSPLPDTDLGRPT